MAVFEIKTAFKLSGRNILVLGGDILNGIISVGDVVQFSDDQNTYNREIISVEAIDYNIGRPDFYAHIGLVIEKDIDSINPREIIMGRVPIMKIDLS